MDFQCLPAGMNAIKLCHCLSAVFGKMTQFQQLTTRNGSLRIHTHTGARTHMHTHIHRLQSPLRSWHLLRGKVNSLLVISFARFSFQVSIRVMKFALEAVAATASDNKTRVACTTQAAIIWYSIAITTTTYLIDGAKRHDETGNK